MRSCIRLNAVAAWRTSVGALRPDRADVAPHAERLGRRGQAADRAHLVAHEQRGDAEQQQRGADQPEHEQVDRAGVQPLARRLHLQHARRAAARGSAPSAGRTSSPCVNGSRTFSSSAAADRRPSGRGCSAAAALRQHRAGLHAACARSNWSPAPCAGSSRGRLGRETVAAVERVGDLAGDAARQPAGDDVEMAAVEHLQRDRLQQHQRQQDDQQAAPEQRARQDAA